VTVCVGMRGDVVRAMSWRKFISKVSRLVTTKLLSARACHDTGIGCHAFRTQYSCVTNGTT